MAGWKELVIWQKSHQLVLKIYDLLTFFPKDEKFALCDQIKRASYSIPSNIVEGHSKNTNKDLIRAKTKIDPLITDVEVDYRF